MYVDKFYRDLEVYGIRAVRPETIIIKFARLETTNKYKGYNGVSFGYNNDDIIEIYINPLSWEQGSKARRYWLMYHELAHDILNAEHVEAIPENKGKLMYPHSSNFKISDMDEFIEAYQALFEEYSNRKK
jgi:Zn-dependent peptidase ImmA (M78 family)